MALSLWVVPAQAQDTPSGGVIWTPPPSFPRAERDLRTMHDQGVALVRTPPIRDERLLTLADTLGLLVYQDVPLSYLSASQMADSLDYAREQLGQMLRLAQRHPSARHFGLVDHSDTSDPAACSILQQLAAVVRNQGPPGSQTYYVTPFVAADRCGPVVDTVLLDVRNAARPAHRLAAWRAAHPDVPVSVGALGTWVRRDSLRGLLAPHSPEAQARYLERHLGHLFADTLQAAPSAVFVHRWRDDAAQRSDPYGRNYGLRTASDRPRPAAGVVAGFFTRTQTVFAFPAGQRPEAPTPWLVLMGWGCIGLIAIAYFRGPRLQQMVMRYVWAHNFYQESVREGREVLPGSTLAILGNGLAGFVALGVVLGRCFQDDQSVLWALHALPDTLESTLAPLMNEPWLLGAALAAGYAAGLLVWMGGLMGASRYGSSLSVDQALMIIGWPRWLLVLVMIAALTVSSFPPETGRPLVLWVVSGTAGLMLWMTGRTLADFMAVTRTPLALALATVLLSPLFMAFWVGGYLVLRHDVPIAFISHLLTRT